MSEFLCNICLNKNSISEHQLNWPRDFLNCKCCGSIVRNRSLYLLLLVNCPNYKNKKIHQSSPSNNDPIHLKLLNECKEYSYSHYFTDIPNGEYNNNNIKCADLLNLPFDDNSFDIFLTSDVFEHIWDPAKCLNEIYRVLKPNGMYLMVLPIDRGNNKTEQPVLKIDDKIINNKTECGKAKGFDDSPEFHGNPIDNSGSIVTYYWGYDIKNFIEENSNFNCDIYFKHDIEQFGIMGVMNEAIICKKKDYIDYDISNDKQIYYNTLFNKDI
jgi:SAM-dependent methyltransferase